MTRETAGPTSPENAATSYGDKLREILTTPLRMERDDEDRHFALSIVPMLKRLPEEEKHFAKVSILKAFRNVRVGRGLQRTPTVEFPSMAPYCISGMPAVPMVQPHMSGQLYIPAQPCRKRPRTPAPFNGQPQVLVQSNGHHLKPVQPFNGQSRMQMQSNGHQQMPIQSEFQQILIQSNGQQQMQSELQQMLIQSNGQHYMSTKSNGQSYVPLPSSYGQHRMSLQYNEQLGMTGLPPTPPMQFIDQPGMLRQPRTPVQSNEQPEMPGQPRIPVQSNEQPEMPGQPRTPVQSNEQPEMPEQPRTPVQSNEQPEMPGQPQTPVQSNGQPGVHSQSNGLPQISMVRSVPLKRSFSPSPPASQNKRTLRVKVSKKSGPVVSFCRRTRRN